MDCRTGVLLLPDDSVRADGVVRSVSRRLSFGYDIPVNNDRMQLQIQLVLPAPRPWEHLCYRWYWKFASGRLADWIHHQRSCLRQARPEGRSRPVSSGLVEGDMQESSTDRSHLLSFV